MARGRTVQYNTSVYGIVNRQSVGIGARSLSLAASAAAVAAAEPQKRVMLTHGAEVLFLS